MKERNDQIVPGSKLKRSTIVGITTVKAGIKKAGYLVQKPFLSADRLDQARRSNDEDIAKLVFKALSSLKGTALKVAQLLSMEIELLPPEYQQELAKAASRVPPINRALVRKVISNEFGRPPEKVFKQFELVPFAAASLGQVHRAVSHEGALMAVKVQYPGIAESVKGDIELIKAALKPTKFSRIYRECFDEVREVIAEELDYKKEAENTVYFRDSLNDDRLMIPKVYHAYSGKRVLATSLIKGIHLDEWLETDPSQKQRDSYGQLLVDVYLKTFMKGTVHADPNQGNYLFRKDMKLGIIDFGCVEVIEPSVQEGLIAIHNPSLIQDPDSLEEIYGKIGIFFKKNFVDPKLHRFIKKWIEWLTRPTRSEYYDFSKNDDYFLEGIKYVREFYSFIDYFKGSFTYAGKAQYGLFRMLHRIGARVSIRMVK